MQNMHDLMRNVRGPFSAPQRQPAKRIWLQHAAAWLGLGLWGIRLDAKRRALRVAAASDLKFVLPGLLAGFQQESGLEVEVSFGSSGNFARQIRQGLPVDLFMSADEGWVEQLAAMGMTREIPGQMGKHDRGVVYAEGRIALYVSRRSDIDSQALLQGKPNPWAQVNKLAIANPELAPYGRAAREALQALGLWERARAKLVIGENIAQATQFVSTGAAQAGITAWSLALAPEVAREGRHLLLDAGLHAAMHQRMVLIKAAAPQAQLLYDFLQSAGAQEVFGRHGFQR